MILNHLWGLHTHPQQEWQAIDSAQENWFYSISHIFIIALIPALCCYISAVYSGWYINLAELIRLSAKTALLTSFGIYFGLIGGIFALACLAFHLARRYDASPTFTQALELSSYAATPLLICGFSALYPQLWFMTMMGGGGLLYSIYLLFTGVPILIHIRENQRRRYSCALLLSGLGLLFGVATLLLCLWYNGMIPTA